MNGALDITASKRARDWCAEREVIFADVERERRALTACLLGQKSRSALRRLSKFDRCTDVSASPPAHLHHSSEDASAWVRDVLAKRSPDGITWLHLRTGAVREAIAPVKDGAWKRDALRHVDAIDALLWKAAMTVLYLIRQKVRRRLHGMPHEWEDARMAALCGAYTAAEKYQPSMGVEFPSFADAWIRQAIDRYVDNEVRAIRYPATVNAALGPYGRFTTEFHSKHARWPTTEEVASALKVSRHLADKLRVLIQQPLSLDGPTRTSEENAIIDTVTSDELSQDECAERAEQCAQLKTWMARLTERERHVIERRFGLVDGSEPTLDEVGKDLGVTRERIRKLEMVALKKLRAYSDGKPIRCYFYSKTDKLRSTRETGKAAIRERRTAARKCIEAGETVIQVAARFGMAPSSMRELLYGRRSGGQEAAQ